MSKYMKYFGVLIAVALVLTACGGATPTPTEEAAAATEAPTEEAPTTVPPTEVPPEPVNLLFWIMPNGADPQGAIDAEIAEFQKANPNITVTVEVVGWGDAYGRIQTAVQGGEGPCVTQVGTTWVPTFGSMGGLKEFSSDEIAGLGGEEAYVKASWETVVLGGKVVAIPWFADVRAMAYRKDVLEQIGVTPEDAFKDIDSFIATLQKVKDAAPVTADGNPIYPFQHPGRNDWNVWQNSVMWMWVYGGDILNADGTAAAFNSDAAVEGEVKFLSLYGMGLTSPDTLELNSSTTDQRFGEGTVFAYITGPWIISNARNIEASGWTQEAADNLAFAEFPAGPGGQYTFVGGSDLVMMNSCPNQAEAMSLIKFLVSKDSQIRYANAIGMLPATLEGQNDTAFVDDPLFSVFISAAAKGKTAMVIPAWGQVENNLQTALQSLWEDVAALGVGSSPAAADVKTKLDEAAATVDSLLSQ